MQKSKIGEKNKSESKLTNSIKDSVELRIVYSANWYSIWPNNFQVYDVNPTGDCLDPSDRLIRLLEVYRANLY